MSTTAAGASADPRTTGTVNLSIDGPVATLELDNPGRRNTLTEAMWLSLDPLCAQIAADPAARVAVVRGAGHDFSSGADISDLKAILRDEGSGRHDGGAVARGEAALAGLHKPTIAAIDGYCLGGAWQVAAACDVRIASEDAVFGITPAKIGIVYPLGGIERLVRIAGPATAKYLLFSGDFVDAGRALELGLVQEVVDRGGFAARVDSYAATVASRSQLSTQAMKDIVDAVAGTALGTADGAGPVGPEELRAASGHWQRLMDESGEAREGIGAFLDKRTPQFSWNGGPDTARRRGRA